MRDTNRIMPFLMEIMKIWMKYPDMRFGQLMWCLLHYANQEKKDLFYVEEDEFLSLMHKMLEGGE